MIMNKIFSVALVSLLTVGCASTQTQKSAPIVAQASVATSAQPKAKPVAKTNVTVSAAPAALRDSHVVTTALQNQLKQWKGTPYKLGGNSLNGIDCSAFVQRTFTDKFAIAMPRTTIAQKSVGIQIPKEELKPGDLIFFKTNWGRNRTGLHVGIYNGNNQFIHASTSKGVMTSSLNDKYWKQRFYQARRVQQNKSTQVALNT